MTILTDAASRSAALRRERDRMDTLAVIALALCFALAVLGLATIASPRLDLESAEAAPVLIGP